MSVLHKFKSIFNKKGSAGDQGSSPVGSASGGGPHIWPMSEETKASLARGVKYNLRVALRGMRRTGKTSLMARLADRPLDPTKYSPTPEIAAATIYFAAGGGASTTEGAKVELWDIVDEAMPPPAALAGPRGSKPAAPPRPPAADASTVDVYRGCSAVVFLIDATRRETFDYVTALLPEVPPTVAVLIVLNFCDADESVRAVSEKEVDELCRGLPGAATRLVLDAARGGSPPKEFAAAASWMPCSMRSGLGVDAVRAFLDVPFALAQLEALEGTMRGLYRGVDAVRADMMQRRAEARFQIRQASQDAGGVSIVSAGSGGAAGSGSQFSAGSQPASPAGAGSSSSSSKQPPQQTVGNGRKSTSPVQQQPSVTTARQPSPVPAAEKVPRQEAAPPAAKKETKPSAAGKKDGGVNDSFFTAEDDDEDDEPEEEEPTTSEDDDDDVPVTTYPATMSSQRSAGSPSSAGRSPNTAAPPAPPPAAQSHMPSRGSNRSVSTVASGGPDVDGEADGPSPQPRAPPAPRVRRELPEEPVPTSLPTATVEKKSPQADEADPAAATSSEPQQMSNDVNVVDTSVLEPARVDDDFFGGDADDDEEVDQDDEPANDDEGDAQASKSPAAVSPATSTNAVDAPEAEEATTAGDPGQLPPTAADVPAAVASEKPGAAEPAVDVAALLAQMQSTFEAAPAEADADEDADEDSSKKKPKKEKKDKSGKKEKKDKKEKKSKKAAANDGPAFADDEDDDLQVMEA